jgi:AcrR family transcriptional regulator
MTVSAARSHQEGDFLARLPRGRHGLPRAYVLQNQRERLCAAAIALISARGYDETTISQIVSAASLSRRTFYDHFPGKPECFLAAHASIADHLAAAARAAAAPETEWQRRVRARIDAALASFAANPDLVRFFLIAPPRSGHPDLVDAHRRFLTCAANGLTAGAPSRPPRSPAFERALLAGLASLIVVVVEEGEEDRLSELGLKLTELFLAAFEDRDSPRR